MRTHLALFVLAPAILSLMGACKRSSAGSQNCQLVSVTDSTTTVQSVSQFAYDNRNRVTSIVVTGNLACRRTMQYSGNTIMFAVTDTTPGVWTESDTAVLNSAGLITNFTSYYPTSGTSYHEVYFYDATGTAVSSTELENGLPGDTIQYRTTGGDLQYDSVNGQAGHKDDFTYYAAEPIVFGDPTYFRQLLYYGAYYYINKHMLSELYSAGKSYKAYTYVLSNGRIARAVLRQWLSGSEDTVTHTLSYAYSCN